MSSLRTKDLCGTFNAYRPFQLISTATYTTMLLVSFSFFRKKLVNLEQNFSMNIFLYLFVWPMSSIALIFFASEFRFEDANNLNGFTFSLCSFHHSFDCTLANKLKLFIMQGLQFPDIFFWGLDQQTKKFIHLNGSFMPFGEMMEMITDQFIIA